MNILGFRKLFLSAEIAMLSGAILGLSGCALGAFESSGPEPIIGTATPGAPMRGQVFGGQNAISGGHIYLFAAGQSAAAHTYGTGATSLLTSAVLTNNTTATDTASNTGVGAKDGNNNYYVATDSNGFFSISSDYSCPAAVNGYPAEVYLLAVGGNSGGGSNSSIALMAALGPCISASQLAAAVPYININEITTVAAVWALQQFMGNPTGVAGSINIGAPTTNLVGLQNAFTTAGNLANIANGQAGPANTYATPEADRIYTLGDILSYCVNSSSSPVATSCNSLFSSVTPSGSALSTKGVAASTLSAPADTIQAAWYLAQFPTNIGGSGACGTVGAAYACIQGTGAPFTNYVGTPGPSDWTLAVGYAPVQSDGHTQALYGPFYVVLDGYGNAWTDDTKGGLESVVPIAPNGTEIYDPVTSYPVTADSGYAAVNKSAYGTSAAGYARTFSQPRAMTVDSTGNVWVADWNNNSATTNETTISGGTFVCTGTNEVCTYGTVAEFPAATGIGAASASAVAGYYTPALPWGAAADGSGNVYFVFAGSSVNYGSKSVGKLNSSAAYTAGGGVGTDAYTLAIDDNTTATSGPLLWQSTFKGCTATPGGLASVIFQQLTATMATATYSGVTGANTGCAGSVHDKIPGSTGLVVGMAFDASNHMWMVNSATYPFGGAAGTTGAINTVTFGDVLVGSGKAYIPSTTTASILTPVTDANNSYSLMSAAGLGGMNNPQFAEVDGAGNLWVSNYGASTVSELDATGAGTTSLAINSLSGTNGFQHSETASALNGSEGIGIDLSGNVWIANSGSTSLRYMTVLVGAATPVGRQYPASSVWLRNQKQPAGHKPGGRTTDREGMYPCRCAVA